MALRPVQSQEIPSRKLCGPCHPLTSSAGTRKEKSAYTPGEPHEGVLAWKQQAYAMQNWLRTLELFERHFALQQPERASRPFIRPRPQITTRAWCHSALWGTCSCSGAVISPKFLKVEDHSTRPLVNRQDPTLPFIYNPQSLSRSEGLCIGPKLASAKAV